MYEEEYNRLIFFLFFANEKLPFPVGEKLPRAKSSFPFLAF